MQLRGKCVWLIGASSGIGAALAPALAAEGARLVLSARRLEQLQTVAKTVASSGEAPLVMTLDVRDLDSVQRVYEDARGRWGGVDVLLYNTGIAGGMRADSFDTATALNVIDVNYLGLVRAVGALLPDMLARGRGEIAAVSSVAGYAGIPTSAAYSSSKAAMRTFLQALRIELRGRGVGVTTINPGFVKTPMTEGSERRLLFMMSPRAAAGTIVRELLAGRAEIDFPRRLTWPAKLFTSLPRPLYERLAYEFMLGRMRRFGAKAVEAPADGEPQHSGNRDETVR